MLKSLFFRQKDESKELLPPPPPFPSMELEEMPEQDILSDDEFKDLFSEAKKDWDLEEAKTKPPKKLSKRELKKLAKVKPKGAKSGKKEAKGKSAPKEEPFNLDKDFNLMPEPEFRDLEELGIGDLNAEEEIKPKEIEEAEEEITSAIEGAKKYGKKSFFSGLFNKKDSDQSTMPELEADDLDAIRKKISDARNALMGLDLEAARNEYIEIMSIYNKLKPEEQTQIYLEVKDLYYERKNAEELKF